MPVTISDIRAVASSLPGVAERLCHGTPAFYVRRKLLARLQENGEAISIACRREERERRIDEHPDALFVTDHFREYEYVLLDLAAANPHLLAASFEAAWRMKATRTSVAQFDSGKE